MEDLAATEFLTERLETTKNNHDFFSAFKLNRQEEWMAYEDLRSFINQLEQQGQCQRITQRIDPNCEITEVSTQLGHQWAQHCCLKTLAIITYRYWLTCLAVLNASLWPWESKALLNYAALGSCWPNSKSRTTQRF